MERSDLYKKNGRYYLKYSEAESYYKSGLLLECIVHYKFMMKGKLLDLGCGNKPYYDIYSETCDSSVGCDVPSTLHKNSVVEVECAAEDIGRHFPENSFDSVLCTEVLEHTSDDMKVISNVNKLLKPGGSLLISSPFIYVLHEPPYDHRRYTSYGLKKLLEENDFEVTGMHSLGGTYSSAFMIFHAALLKIFYFIFKKAGLKLYKVSFIRAILNLPELILYNINIFSFRNKLNKNKELTVNEMFASPGYFIAAKKKN